MEGFQKGPQPKRKPRDSTPEFRVATPSRTINIWNTLSRRWPPAVYRIVYARTASVQGRDTIGRVICWYWLLLLYYCWIQSNHWHLGYWSHSDRYVSSYQMPWNSHPPIKSSRIPGGTSTSQWRPPFLSDTRPVNLSERAREHSSITNRSCRRSGLESSGCPLRRRFAFFFFFSFLFFSS